MATGLSDLKDADHEVQFLSDGAVEIIVHNFATARRLTLELRPGQWFAPYRASKLLFRAVQPLDADPAFVRVTMRRFAGAVALPAVQIASCNDFPDSALEWLHGGP